MQIWVILLVFTFCVPSQAQTVATPSQEKVYVFAQRTERHAKYSDSDVFNEVRRDVEAYLVSKKAALAQDAQGRPNFSQFKTSFDRVLELAREAKAASVVYLTVDRPLSKWVKVTVECYDASGKKLWEEKAESVGGLSGDHGLRVMTERLHSDLDKHIGQAGIPVITGTLEAK